jgi:hypothetical protein
MPKPKRMKVSVADPFVANIKAEVQWQMIENPSWTRANSDLHNRHVQQRVNVAESAIATLHARGHISEHQVRAADKFRALWEAMGGAGAGAVDYTREPVDGGGARDPISVRQMEAGRELARCREILGYRGYTLVSRVCGEGLSLSEIGSIKREKIAAAENLRAHLDDLCAMWGYKTAR